jgi:hypothetical protein
MIDLNHRNPSAHISALVDAAVEAKAAQERPRDYLGASILGKPCARYLQYCYFNTPKNKPFSGRILRIFQRGHAGEDWMIGWLRQAGFVLSDRQGGFSTAGGRIQGHCDGAIVAGPEGYAYPCLWENKVLGAKGWNKTDKEGVKKAYPDYYGQLQLYMAYLDLADNSALFTALNADTMKIHAELVPFDPQEAQRLSDRAVTVLKACDAGDLLPRLSDDSTWFQCKWCDYHGRCHGDG